MATHPTIGQLDFEAVRCLGAPLNEKLAAYARLHQKHQSAVAALYDDLVQRLVSGGAGQTAPTKGAQFAAFILPDCHGRLVALDDLLRCGPLVVSFNRGSWCPYCRLELLALAEIHPDVKKLGGNIVSIIPERGKSSGNLKELYDLPFGVLSDMDNGYALANGLMISIGADLRMTLLEHDINLADLHGNEGLFVPITATYVVARDGIVRDADVNPDFRQRMPPDQVIEALKRLQ